MKRLFQFLILIALFCSCEQMEDADLELVTFTHELTETNRDLQDFAQTISMALRENNDIRTILKQDIMNKHEGEYEVLVSKFQTHQVRNATHLKSSESNDLKNVLDSYYLQIQDVPVLKSKESFLEKLVKKYPDMCISIPVNAEKWVSDSYVPKVVFVYEEVVEFETKVLPGFDNYGKKILVDAISDPTEPIVVVKFSERYKDPNQLKSRIVVPGPINPPNVEVPSPNNLTLEAQAGGIFVRWEKSSSANSSNTIGYIVYRKGPYDNSFNAIKHVYGMDNTVCTDINQFTAGQYYSYYIKSFYSDPNTMQVLSDPTDIKSIKAPNRPKDLESFDAMLIGKDNMELRWDLDNSEFVDKVIIERMRHNVDLSYTNFGAYDYTEGVVLDNSLREGIKVTYQAKVKNAFGYSDYKYDIVHVPHRDITKNSSIKVRKIVTDLKEVEPWYNGAPEFYLTVLGVNSTTLKSQIYVDPLTFQFDKRTNVEYFYQNIFEWIPDLWWDVVSFHLIEFERHKTKATINASAKYQVKDSEKKNLTTDVGASVGIEYNNDGQQDCGVTYITYYEHPSKELEFFHSTTVSIYDPYY